MFREQSAHAQGQSEAREGIAAQLQELLQHTFPGISIISLYVHDDWLQHRVLGHIHVNIM